MRGVWTGAVFAVAISSVAAQGDRRDRYGDGDRMTRLDPGMTISIRTNEPIDARDANGRVFTGTVDRDIRGENGRLAIPRGSTAELVVRRARGDELALDLESVVVNGQRYGLKTDPNEVVGTTGGEGIVANIMGKIRVDVVHRQEVRVRQGTTFAFRLDRPLELGVPDRGSLRDHVHYHDYDRDPRHE
jgi:hypothetical protein